MENFAEYILEEKKLDSKIEIVYYLSKKAKIFFDKSVIFKNCKIIFKLFKNRCRSKFCINSLFIM